MYLKVTSKMANLMTKEYLGLLMDVSMKGNGKMEIQME